METFRDWMVIIAGIIHALVGIIWAALWFLAWRYTGKGFKALDRLIDDKARPMLGQGKIYLASARDFTARLPGAVPLPEGEVLPERVQRRRGSGMPVPWRRRRGPRWLRR